jgi:hypothetical protein
MDHLFNPDLFLLLGIPVALYFFAVPLVTKFTFQTEAEPTLVLADIDSRLDDQADAYLAETTRQLVDLGFDPVCLISVPQMVANVKAWVKLFVHPQQDDSALVELFFVQQGEQWKLQNECVEISSEYSDGTVVTTGNNQVLPSWPISERKTLSVFRGVQELGWLYRAHQAICRLIGPGKRKVVDLYSEYDGDAVACLAAGMKRENAPAIEAGYLYYKDGQSTHDGAVSTPNPYAPPSATSVPAHLRATWKGAYLMTWKVLWPINRFLMRSRVRRSYRLLTEAGFEG